MDPDADDVLAREIVLGSEYVALPLAASPGKALETVFAGPIRIDEQKARSRKDQFIAALLQIVAGNGLPVPAAREHFFSVLNVADLVPR